MSTPLDANGAPPAARCNALGASRVVGPPAPIPEVGERVGIQPRTAYRVTAALRRAGAPLHYTEGPGTGGRRRRFYSMTRVGA